jgi:phospholipase/carboxylesterase
VSDGGLVFRERPATGTPEGLLVLHHGRGTDESDLLTLGEVLDPQHRLAVVTPRGPLQLAGSPGFHWYLVPQVGRPDPETFAAAFAQLSALYDELWQRTGVAPSRTVLGGFSMGAVMSYSLGLGPGRPRPAGIVAFSGFIPTVGGWHADLPARQAQATLAGGGLQVEYAEYDGGHRIDPRGLPAAQAWLERTLPS